MTYYFFSWFQKVLLEAFAEIFNVEQNVSLKTLKNVAIIKNVKKVFFTSMLQSLFSSIAN